MKLQNAGLYYFLNKDETIILCAEETALRLENALISPALKGLSNPDLMIRRLQSRTYKMDPTMRPLALVCVSKCYKDSVGPVLDRLSGRYDHYTDLIAKK